MSTVIMVFDVRGMGVKQIPRINFHSSTCNQYKPDFHKAVWLFDKFSHNLLILLWLCFSDSVRDTLHRSILCCIIPRRSPTGNLYHHIRSLSWQALLVWAPGACKPVSYIYAHGQRRNKQACKPQQLIFASRMAVCCFIQQQTLS